MNYNCSARISNLRYVNSDKVGCNLVCFPPEYDINAAIFKSQILDAIAYEMHSEEFNKTGRMSSETLADVEKRLHFLVNLHKTKRIDKVPIPWHLVPPGGPHHDVLCGRVPMCERSIGSELSRHGFELFNTPIPLTLFNSSKSPEFKELPPAAFDIMDSVPFLRESCGDFQCFVDSSLAVCGNAAWSLGASVIVDDVPMVIEKALLQTEREHITTVLANFEKFMNDEERECHCVLCVNEFDGSEHIIILLTVYRGDDQDDVRGMALEWKSMIGDFIYRGVWKVPPEQTPICKAMERGVRLDQWLHSGLTTTSNGFPVIIRCRTKRFMEFLCYAESRPTFYGMDGKSASGSILFMVNRLLAFVGMMGIDQHMSMAVFYACRRPDFPEICVVMQDERLRATNPNVIITYY